LKYATSLARRYGASIFLAQMINVDGYPLLSPEYATAAAQTTKSEADKGLRDLLKTGELIGLPYKVCEGKD
jgi:hypothetical protein